MMKKIVLLFVMMVIHTLTYSQDKPKNMRQLRDSIFTVMKLSDLNRQKMHEMITENGKGQKAIKDDVTLTEEQRKEKLQSWKQEMDVKEKNILTPEESVIWRAYAKSLRSKPKA
jgi:Spy/CpxP family protein refolding chaperone